MLYQLSYSRIVSRRLRGQFRQGRAVSPLPNLRLYALREAFQGTPPGFTILRQVFRLRGVATWLAVRASRPWNTPYRLAEPWTWVRWGNATIQEKVP